VAVLSSTKREGAGNPSPPAIRFEPTAGMIVDGKYRVERLLGEGGMGVVVAATHEGLDQRVAIKFLHADAMRNKEAVERFQREAKVAAKVKSEHVTRVFDVGAVEEAGVPYIVMEYLEGGDLGDLIDEHGRLPIDDACEIALQACEALAEVHAAGIVHRDLKPSNLFVTRRADGSPCLKLLDFGISKFTVHPDDSTVDPALTQTATIMGSPSYMSPEQLKSTKEVDARTDVWSLGAVLYEGLVGKPAFRGETVPQVCAMIASDEPAPPSSLRGGLPADLERTVLACLEKKPERRASLVDLARVLARHAPDRALASLERIEAVLGVAPSEQRPRQKSRLASGEELPRQKSRVAPSEELPREKSRADEMPVLPLATAKAPPNAARTQSSWQEERQGRRGGSGALLLLVVVAGGLFAYGLFTGRIDVKGWKGDVKGWKGDVASASSAMSSAVVNASSVVASASSAIASAIPSAIPSDIPLPVFEPDPSAAPSSSAAPSASGSAAPAASDEPDDEDEDIAPSATTAPPSAPHYVPPKKHGKPKHHKPYPRHR
jgi:serine/threonine-protein kinase